MSVEAVRVELGERGYDILIGAGLLERAGGEIAERLGDVRVGIVTDRTVADLHLGTVRRSLADAGLDHTLVTVEAGEPSKSWATLERVVDGLLDAREALASGRPFHALRALRPLFAIEAERLTREGREAMAGHATECAA